MSELVACCGCYRTFYGVNRKLPDECSDCGHDGTGSAGAGWKKQVKA